jgi:hypothetical protein
VKPKQANTAIALLDGWVLDKKKLEHGSMLRCPMCKTHNLKIHDCGYSSFNAGHVECGCGYKVDFKNLNNEKDYVKAWNDHVLSLIPDYWNSIEEALRVIKKTFLTRQAKGEFFQALRNEIEQEYYNPFDDYWHAFDILVGYTAMNLCTALLKAKKKWLYP